MHYIIYVLKVNVNIKKCKSIVKNSILANFFADSGIKIGFNANEKLPLREVFHFLGKEY